MKGLPLILVLIFLISCSNQDYNGKYTLSMLTDEMKEHGIKLNVADCGPVTLNNVAPTCFKTENNNFLYIYEFTTSGDVQKALEDFEENNRNYNIVIPQIFKLENILILYYTNENRTDPYENRDEKILYIVNELIKERETVS